MATSYYIIKKGSVMAKRDGKELSKLKIKIKLI